MALKSLLSQSALTLTASHTYFVEANPVSSPTLLLSAGIIEFKDFEVIIEGTLLGDTIESNPVAFLSASGGPTTAEGFNFVFNTHNLDPVDTVGGGGGGGDLTDGDYGDITVGGSGTTMTIDNDVVTNAKAANMANARIKGRATAGTGDPEDLTASQVKTLLAITASDVSGLAAVATSGAAADISGLATVATSGSAADLTGTLSGAQLPSFTGDVTNSGAAMTIAADAVTNAKLANMAANTLKGNNTGGSANPTDLSVADVKTMLNLAGTNSGDQTTIVGITGTLAEFNAALTGADFERAVTDANEVAVFRRELGHAQRGGQVAGPSGR